MQHKRLVGTLFLTPELFDGKNEFAALANYSEIRVRTISIMSWILRNGHQIV